MGMIDIDTAYSISSHGRLLSILSPFFRQHEINALLVQKEPIEDPESLALMIGDELKITVKPDINRKALEEIIKEANSRITVSVMRPFRTYNETVINTWNNHIGSRLLYFCSADSVTSTNKSLREGKSPLSPIFMTTNNIIRILEDINNEYYDSIAFMFPQPLLQTLIPTIKNENIALEDMLSEELESFKALHPSARKGEEIVLWKDNAQHTTISLWHYNNLLFGTRKPRHHKNNNNIQPSTNPLEHDMRDAIDIKKDYIARRLLGLSISRIIESDHENIMRIVDSYDLPGIPVYTEKTSYTYDAIFNHAIKLSDKELSFHHVGRTNYGKSIPLLGINEPTSLGYLTGHIQRTIIGIKPVIRRLDENKNNNNNKNKKNNGQNINGNKKRLLNLVTEKGYPHLLLEESASNKRPSIVTLYDEMSPAEKRIVIDYCNYHRVGVQRVEQRITELLHENVLVYYGSRKNTKKNQYWNNMIKDNRLLLASELPGFMDMINNNDADNNTSVPDIRGSEMGIKPLECVIANIIGRMSHTTKRDIITQTILETGSNEHNILFDHKGNPLAASRGTLLHHLWNHPIGNDSAHLEILSSNGITPLDTNNYCEITIRHTIPEEHTNGIKVDFSCHPDALLFMESNDTGRISILTVDRKTNPRTIYPEPAYIRQVSSYNWVIEYLLNSHLGYDVEANYIVLDKNPYHHTRNPNDHNMSASLHYRKHEFSPITMLDTNIESYNNMPVIMTSIAQRKREYYGEPAIMALDKSANEECGICKNCYASTKMVCDSIVGMASSQSDDIIDIIKPSS
ncbi:MAG: hypothetical protein ACMXYL_01970 [Candidatus Woesearchaeota archaeon]